jgi:response regulator RpfG family c-di-GMP phosphodiesterase
MAESLAPGLNRSERIVPRCRLRGKTGFTAGPRPKKELPLDRTGDWQIVDPLALAPAERPMLSALEFLHYLADSRLYASAELDAFLNNNPGLEEGDASGLINALVSQGRLNDYQVGRLLAGQTFGLVLGHYRILERVGAGGMGVVYKAEHIHMRRAVALKILAAEDERNSVFLQRFYGEMEALAVLRHPNIVLAFDAGEVDMPHSSGKVLRYLVMEYVTGRDLEQVVLQDGALSMGTACHYVRQAAEGLRHAHEHGLVHRDIKPSNLLVTPQEQVKILDFGLARLCRRRCTEAHAMLGTVEYMAPEQARDARAVDIRADIYGLGGVLHWLLAGQKPFPGDRPPLQELLARQRETPPPLRTLRPDVPLELEAIVSKMMAQNPNDRYPTPLAVISALNAFLDRTQSRTIHIGPPTHPGIRATDTLFDFDLTGSQPQPAPGNRPTHRVLVVSSRPEQRSYCRDALDGQGIECLGAQSAVEVIDWLVRSPCDLLLIDADLPDGGADLCRRLRSEPPAAHLKLILVLPDGSAPLTTETPADDYLERSVPPHELAARVKLALRLKDAEERSDRMNMHLLATNGQLEETLRQRDDDMYQAQDVLIFAMAKMAELRGLETGAHLLRMQGYVRVLAEESMRLPAFAGRIDGAFTRMLERCVLLHDIGKVAIPDHILMKPGRLDVEERSIMESHTITGADLLEAVAKQHGACLAFLQMAIDIVRHHHERFDGSGYPDGLSGEAIPLAARIVTVADVYDALRCKLVYKPGLAHPAARRLILDPDKGQFDPGLLVAFRNCEVNFQTIFEQTSD